MASYSTDTAFAQLCRKHIQIYAVDKVTSALKSLQNCSRIHVLREDYLCIWTNRQTECVILKIRTGYEGTQIILPATEDQYRLIMAACHANNYAHEFYRAPWQTVVAWDSFVTREHEYKFMVAFGDAAKADPTRFASLKADFP